MTVRTCSLCQQPGHYAPRCPSRPNPAPPREPPPALDRVQAAVDVIERTAGARAEARRRKPKVARTRLPPPEASSEVLDPPERPGLRRSPATHPYDHTLREGQCGELPGILWRHTWVHDGTGERIVATVPLPPSGDRYESGEGLVVFRRVLDAIEVQRDLPTARVEVYTAAGTYVGHVGPVDEDAASTSPDPAVPHPYGEGLW